MSTLLSWAWVAHTIEVDNVVEAAASERVGQLFRISLAMWANGLRWLDDEGSTVGQVRAKARADCNIGGLERWGWLEVDSPGSAGQRRAGYGSRRGITAATVVRPTRAGRYARRVWPEAVDRVEQQWRIRFGPAVIDELYTATRAALSAPTGVARLPWAPPEVDPSTGFRTRTVDAGPDVEAPRDEAADAQKVDAQAAASHIGQTGEDQPLVVLLGQTLTAATLRHEQDAEVSLPLSANLLRVLDREPVAVAELPHLSGVSKEAIAMAVGYLTRSGLADVIPTRSVVRTRIGRDALDRYRAWAERYDDSRLRDALGATLTQTDALVSGLTPPPQGWRANPPYRKQTERLLADPTGALPWHPMVLHRGGWPDGS